MMTKFLFFDYRELEVVEGFERRLERPEKHAGNPMFIADQPWERGNMQLYGSVVKAPGKPFQCWYSIIHPPFVIYLAYAESDDGLAWRKPLFDIFQYEGEQTNIVFAGEPHGAAVIYDADEPAPERRYKMMCGATPTHCICGFTSADGIHWRPVSRFPQINTNPDCPMAFYREPGGRYVAHHRVYGYGRRIFRSESWDFIHWSSEPRMVMEPDAGDPPQVQFYGSGATAYGSYHVGTLWMYHTDVADRGGGKMKGYQEVELIYARSGHAWHRAAQGTPFIPHGAPGSWEQGNLQCASAPVFLDDEIRYYYMGTDMFHKGHWELDPQTAGLGMARLKPDRFLALAAGADPAELLTATFTLPAPQVYVNAAVAAGGYLKVELLDDQGAVIPGFEAESCAPATGDSTAHAVSWEEGREAISPVGRPVRLRLRAKSARVYSIFSCEPDEVKAYWQFRAVRP